MAAASTLEVGCQSSPFNIPHLLSFSETWNTLTITGSMTPSDDSNTCFHSGSILTIDVCPRSWLFVNLIPLYWIRDFVSFPLLGAGYLGVPLNILELCSGVQLSYLKAVHSFWSMPSRLARQDQSSVHHSPVPRQSLLGPDSAPCGPELLAWLVGMCTILSPM